MSNEFVMVPRALIERLEQFGEGSTPGRTVRKDALEQLYASCTQPAEQYQGEPVALPERKEVVEEWATPGGPYRAEGWNACLDEIAKLGPLYTHADSGEVERLRAENIRLIEDRARFPDRPDDIGRMITCHIGNLKNQVKSSEDYARKWRWGLEAAERKLAELEALCWGLIGSSGKKRAQYLEKLQASLSASAEPSAPARNQCDGCQAGIPIVNGAHRMGRPGGYTDAMSCQASRYESAPVEIDESRTVRRFTYISIYNEGCALVPLDDGPDPDFDTGTEYVEASYYDEARAALSASAKPSAPVERDERAEFVAHMRKQGGLIEWALGWDGARFEHPPTQGKWETWQARAALERMP